MAKKMTNIQKRKDPIIFVFTVSDMIFLLVLLILVGIVLFANLELIVKVSIATSILMVGGFSFMKVDKESFYKLILRSLIFFTFKSKRKIKKQEIKRFYPQVKFIKE